MGEGQEPPLRALSTIDDGSASSLSLFADVSSLVLISIDRFLSSFVPADDSAPFVGCEGRLLLATDTPNDNSDSKSWSQRSRSAIVMMIVLSDLLSAIFCIIRSIN